MVIIVLLLALTLRLVSLNQSLWLDEAVQAITSAGPFSGIFTELVGDFHPPLYHIFMWGWVHLFGNSEIILRLPSVLFGVGAVYLGYKIIRLLSNKVIQITNTQSLITILLFATSPYLIYYSQEARMYSMAAFLATLSSWLFIKIIVGTYKENSNNKIQIHKSNLKLEIQNYLPFILVNITLVYADYYGWLVVLAQSLVLIYQKKWKFLILNSLFLILVYLPWLNMLITQVKAGVQATQSLPVWASLVNLSVLKAIPLTFIKFSIGRISFVDKQLYLLVILSVTGVYITLGILGSLGFFPSKFRVRNLLDKGKEGYFGYLILWFVVPLTIAWLVSFKVPNFQPFRLILILPAFHLITAYLISNIKWIKLRWLIFFVVVSFNLGGYWYYQLTPSMQREDWRGLVDYSDSKRATLLIPSESSNWPVRYYTNGGTKIVYGATGAEQVVRPPTIGGNTIYYLRYLVPVFDPGEKILNQLQALGYNKIEAVNFNQLEVWKYQLTN